MWSGIYKKPDNSDIFIDHGPASRGFWIELQWGVSPSGGWSPEVGGAKVQGHHGNIYRLAM